MKQSKITYNLKPLADFTSSMKDYKARIGVLGDKAVRTDGEGDLNNAEIALIQITGSFENNIPPRDCLLFPVEYNQAKIRRQMSSAGDVKAALARGDIKRVFALLGAICEGFIQEAFESAGFGQWAPNAESTIARKGSSKPLIDSSQLRRAFTSVVVKKGTVV